MSKCTELLVPGLIYSVVNYCSMGQHGRLGTEAVEAKWSTAVELDPKMFFIEETLFAAVCCHAPLHSETYDQM